MIHRMAKTYSLNIQSASEFKEKDFYEMLAFENMESLKEEYLLKNYYMKNNNE